MFCEMPSIFDDRRVPARKAHKCYECRAPILPGEVYHSISGLWDGRWSRFKICDCCEKKRCALAAYFNEDCGIPFGELWEWEHEWEIEQGIAREN